MKNLNKIIDDYFFRGEYKVINEHEREEMGDDFMAEVRTEYVGFIMDCYFNIATKLPFLLSNS